MVSPSSVAATRHEVRVTRAPQGTQEPSPAVSSAGLPWDVTPPSQRSGSELLALPSQSMPITSGWTRS